MTTLTERDVLFPKDQERVQIADLLKRIDLPKSAANFAITSIDSEEDERGQTSRVFAILFERVICSEVPTLLASITATVVSKGYSLEEDPVIENDGPDHCSLVLQLTCCVSSL